MHISSVGTFIGGGKGGAKGARAPQVLLSLHKNVIFPIQMCPDNLNSPHF